MTATRGLRKSEGPYEGVDEAWGGQRDDDNMRVDFERPEENDDHGDPNKNVG